MPEARFLRQGRTMRYSRWLVVLAVVTSAVAAGAFLAVPSPAGASSNSTAARLGAAAHRLMDVPALLRPKLVTASAPHHAARTWTVRPGQTLSTIAQAAYGKAALWPALWWVNKARVHNPDYILAGETLSLSSWHPQEGWLYRAGKAADGPVGISAPSRPIHRSAGQVRGKSYGDPNFCGDGDGDGWDVPCGHAVRQVSSTRHYRSYASSTYHGGGGTESCIIARESGGNSRAVNPTSGAGGLYQFLPSTWHALGHGGLPENASVGEQQQAFRQEVAQSGYSAWHAYDGCG